MDGIVVRAQEVEAVGGEGRGGMRPIARGEHLAEPERARTPLPTATSEPTTLRIMWCRNASALKVKRQYAPRRSMARLRSVLTGTALGTRPTKGAEVVPAHERLGGLLHGGAVELAKVQPARPVSTAARTGDSSSR